MPSQYHAGQIVKLDPNKMNYSARYRCELQNQSIDDPRVWRVRRTDWATGKDHGVVSIYESWITEVIS